MVEQKSLANGLSQEETPTHTQNQQESLEGFLDTMTREEVKRALIHKLEEIGLERELCIAKSNKVGLSQKEMEELLCEVLSEKGITNPMLVVKTGRNKVGPNNFSITYIPQEASRAHEAEKPEPEDNKDSSEEASEESQAQQSSTNDVLESRDKGTRINQIINSVNQKLIADAYIPQTSIPDLKKGLIVQSVSSTGKELVGVVLKELTKQHPLFSFHELENEKTRGIDILASFDVLNNFEQYIDDFNSDPARLEFQIRGMFLESAGLDSIEKAKKFFEDRGCELVVTKGASLKDDTVFIVKKPTIPSDKSALEGVRGISQLSPEEIAKLDTSYSALAKSLLKSPGSDILVTPLPKVITFTKDDVGKLQVAKEYIENKLKEDPNLKDGAWKSIIHQDEIDEKAQQTSLYVIHAEDKILDTVNTVLSDPTYGGVVYIRKEYLELFNINSGEKLANKGFEIDSEKTNSHKELGVVCLKKKSVEIVNQTIDTAKVDQILVSFNQKMEQLAYISGTIPNLEIGEIVQTSTEDAVNVQAALVQLRTQHPLFRFSFVVSQGKSPEIIAVFDMDKIDGYIADFLADSNRSDFKIRGSHFVGGLGLRTIGEAQTFFTSKGLEINVPQNQSSFIKDSQIFTSKRIGTQNTPINTNTVSQQSNPVTPPAVSPSAPTPVIQNTLATNARQQTPPALPPEKTYTEKKQEEFVQERAEAQKKFEEARDAYHVAIKDSVEKTGFVKRFLGTMTGIRREAQEVRVARLAYEEAIKELSRPLLRNYFDGTGAWHKDIELTDADKERALKENKEYLAKTLVLVDEMKAVNQARAEALEAKRNKSMFKSVFKFLEKPAVRKSAVIALSTGAVLASFATGGVMPAVVAGTGVLARAGIRKMMDRVLAIHNENLEDQKLREDYEKEGLDPDAFLESLRKARIKERNIRIAKQIGSRVAGAVATGALTWGIHHTYFSPDSHAPSASSLENAHTSTDGATEVPSTDKGADSLIDATENTSNPVGKNTSTPSEVIPGSKAAHIETHNAVVSAKSGEGATQVLERMMDEQGDRVPDWFRNIDQSAEYQRWLTTDAKKLPEWAAGHEKSLYVTEKFGMSDYVEKAFDAESQSANAPTTYDFNESAVIYRGDRIGFTDNGEFFLQRANGETTIFTDGAGNQLTRGGERVFYNGPMNDTDSISGASAPATPRPSEVATPRPSVRPPSTPIGRSPVQSGYNYNPAEDVQQWPEQFTGGQKSPDTTVPVTSVEGGEVLTGTPVYTEGRPPVPILNRGGDATIPVVNPRSFVNNVGAQVSTPYGNVEVTAGNQLNPRVWADPEALRNSPRIYPTPTRGYGRSASIEQSPLATEDLASSTAEQVASPAKRRGILSMIFSALFGK